jgi:hypothetical protein
MNQDDLARDRIDDELAEGWFEQGELADVSGQAPDEEGAVRRSRFGVVVAAISATALTLVIVFAGRF